MAAAPNSYKDPYWTGLASSVEGKLDLPKGLLVAIVNRGERSNNDAVSEAGAKTPFQIIPATRKAAIDKWGIDPMLNPENAAEVAGRLLKESLDRNKGDASLAVAEYHGGTDRANWGPRTKAYVQRVTGGPPQAGRDAAPKTSAEAPPPATPQPQQSTFQRALAAQQAAAPATTTIANVFQAYQSGQMSPDEAQEFEADVKAGTMMLPRGAKLKTAEPAPATSGGAMVLPDGVAQAYRFGSMPAEDRAQLESDVSAGLVKLPDAPQIPGTPAQQPVQAAPEPSTLDKVVGIGEGLLTAGTGALGGVAAIGGMLGGVADAIRTGDFGTPAAANRIEQGAAGVAQAFTYEPRTDAGRGFVENVVAPVGQALLPLAGLTGNLPAATGAAGQSMRAAGQITSAAVPRAVQAVRQGAAAIAERVLPDATSPVGRQPTPGTLGSVGAAGTEMAAQRTATAGSLPVPIRLTTGQASRDFEQLRFEKETAKDPTRGAPLRERGEQQNAAILQNFDAWLDATGAEAPDVVATGRAVTGALVERAARDKAQVRAAYKAADNAGEMADPVAADAIAKVLDESRSAESTAPVLTAARKELIRLGGAADSADGALIPADMTLGNVEQLRKFINKVTGIDPTNQKFAGDLKRAIDASTEGAGGEAYQHARGLRAKYARTYEDRAVVADLLSNRRGMADPKVSVDRVFQRSILNGSPEDVRYLRRVLQTGGDNGKQAWRELQGSTLNHIREQATRGVSTDQRGNPVVSPAGLDGAIKQLDKNGRLEIVFGKQGAQQLRDINDISKFVNTAPPGAINTSNTASVLLAALAEAGVSGSMTGIPVPVLSLVRVAVAHSKDRRIQQRVMRALNNEAERQTRPGRTRPVAADAPSAPIH